MMKGYRTYVMAILCGLVTAASVMGWLDSEQYKALMAVFAPATAVFLRAGMKNG